MQKFLDLIGDNFRRGYYMNIFNWKMVVASVLTMFLSVACSKKLMPPEMETSNAGIESSDLKASNETTPSEKDEPAGSGGPNDSRFFSEEPVLENSNASSNSSSGMMADGSGSGNGGSDNPFDGGSNADIGNGSSGRFDADSSDRSGSQDPRSQSYHAIAELKDIHFNFDQYDLDNNTKKILKENAAYLKGHPDMRVEIQGHCDERGTNNYNIALGERRAHSTKKYLVSQGVDSSRMNVISYGEEKPFCSNSNANCWHQNRRAHFMVAK
jgi:peptidoglycan-associated lipoprotein